MTTIQEQSKSKSLHSEEPCRRRLLRCSRLFLNLITVLESNNATIPIHLTSSGPSPAIGPAAGGIPCGGIEWAGIIGCM